MAEEETYKPLYAAGTLFGLNFSSLQRSNDNKFHTLHNRSNKQKRKSFVGLYFTAHIMWSFYLSKVNIMHHYMAEEETSHSIYQTSKSFLFVKTVLYMADTTPCITGLINSIYCRFL